MRFLYLIEKHDGVRMTAHLLGELSALLITDIPRRRADEPGDIEALSVFAHVDADKGILCAEHLLCEALGKIGLTYTRRPEEHERADRMIRIFQSDAVSLDGFHHLVDGTVLADDKLLQLRTHIAKALALSLSHALHRNASHHRHDIGNFLLCDSLSRFSLALLPFLLQETKLLLQFCLTVTVVGGELEVLRADGILLLTLDVLDILLLIGDLLRHLSVLQMDARADLIDDVDSLVGHETVGDVTVSETHGFLQSVVSVSHVMMILVTFLDVL